MKLQIVGKVSNLQRKDVLNKFLTAERYLQYVMQVQVINPIRFIKANTSWSEAMEMCLESIYFNADGIYCLADFKNSKGGVIEWRFAKKHKKVILYESEPSVCTKFLLNFKWRL